MRVLLFLTRKPKAGESKWLAYGPTARLKPRSPGVLVSTPPCCLTCNNLVMCRKLRTPGDRVRSLILQNVCTAQRGNSIAYNLGPIENKCIDRTKYHLNYHLNSQYTYNSDNFFGIQNCFWVWFGMEYTEKSSSGYLKKNYYFCLLWLWVCSKNRASLCPFFLA